MTGFFQRLFKRSNKTPHEAVESAEGDTQMTAIQARLQRAAESILENEALTADLDDEAAQALLDWGIALAQRIVSQTAELDDEAAAEAITYPPLRALRKMLRTINQWAAAPDPAGLEKILEQAAITYGAGNLAPASGMQMQFADQAPPGARNPAENIRQLRDWLENQVSNHPR